jgi:prepilin-type N-terminal cleavage/methylation domain-containing protein
MNRAPRTHGAPTMAGMKGGVYFEGRDGSPLPSLKNSGTRGDSRPYLRNIRGFTLLEMVMVLVIIAILAAASLPAFESAVNEHRVREDGHELALMVRSAMIQSSEQHRPFEIDLTKNTMALHAQGEQTDQSQDENATLFKDSGSTATNADQPIADTVTSDVDVEQQLEDPNKLQVPDPSKTDGWMDMPGDGVQWIFQPGELCPASKIRIVRGDAYLEMDFGALTGGVDTEKYYFP